MTLTIGVRVNARTSGGGQVFAQELVAALRRHPSNPSVRILSVGDTPRDDASVSVQPSDLPVVGRLLTARRFRKAVDTQQLDVILSPGTDRLPKVDALRVLWPLTVAPFEQGARKELATSTRSRLKWRALAVVVGEACLTADALVFSSKYAQDLHRRVMPWLRRTPATVIRPAASLEVDRPRWSPRRERPYLLFVSHLYRYKMLEQLIRGFAEAHEKAAGDLRLVVAGNEVDAAYASHCKQVARDLRVDHLIDFTGGVGPRELNELYEQASGFVFTSASENAGSYALIDAFAHGLPVISSSASSMPEVCGSAADMVDPWDPSAIATAILRLATDEQHAADLARRSREHIEWFPTWDEIAADFVRLCEMALDDAS